jgi:hypothetical protein
MKEVEYFAFMLPPDIWRKKGGPSTWKMTIEDAAERYPGAQPIMSTREVRFSGESQITADSPYQRRASRTPEEEAYAARLVSGIGAKSRQLDDESDPAPDTTHRQ